MASLFPDLFQLVSDLFFHLLRQRATVRDFLVIHQVFVEVREVQLVEFNLLQFVHADTPAVRMF